MTISPEAAKRFPGLPVPMKHGVGARVGDVVYVGLGTMGTGWYALDLAAAEPRWVEMAAFPHAPREQARTLAIDGQIYVFGGVGKADDQAASVIMFDEVHRYDTAANTWHQQATRSPQGLLGNALWSPDGRQILSFGGANKAILDSFFADMAAADEATQTRITAAYFDQRPEDYRFTADVLSYTPATNRWMNLGKLPFPPTVGAAVADRNGQLLLVNGELKPGLRSPSAHAGTFDGARMHWSTLPDLIGMDDGIPQEGLAGAYAGFVGDVLLVAGGTNFPGSWAAFNAGNNWAHRGLVKTWHDTVFALADGQWRIAGNLPQAMAGGLSFAVDDGVLLVGGELQDGAATDAVVLLLLDGTAVAR